VTVPLTRRRGHSPIGDDALLDLVGRIYETALQPETWPDVLTRIADRLQAVSGSLIIHDCVQPAVSDRNAFLPQVHVTRLDPETLGEYQRHWIQHDPGLKAMELMSAGALATDETVSSREEWLRSAIYNDFLLPRQIARVLAGLPVRDRQGVAHVFFHRPSSQGAYEAGEQELLRRILPHLARALTIRRHFLDMSRQRQAALEALDHSPVGVVLLGPGGEVTHMNRAAEEIVAEADGLTVARGRLYAARPAETRELQRRIHDAVATGNGRGPGDGGAQLLSRPSPRRPLAVLVTPLFLASALGPLRQATAAVFVRDPEREPASPPDQMRALYGLTPAEARLACHLANGLSLREAAQRLEVTVETVRSQVKRIFEKTDTRRQAELVALLARSFLTPPNRSKE
jgi:DNA-binding CsgD family transcriptional regulator/PAS domain-containing protein